MTPPIHPSIQADVSGIERPVFTRPSPVCRLIFQRNLSVTKSVWKIFVSFQHMIGFLFAEKLNLQKTKIPKGSHFNSN